MRRLLEQTRKELIQVFRDKRAMLFAVGLPAMLLVIMPQSISLTVDDLPIVVQDLDDSAASRLFIDAFRASITFRVIGWPVDEHPEAAFKANAARALGLREAGRQCLQQRHCRPHATRPSPCRGSTLV